jgi:hypothetical protein
MPSILRIKGYRFFFFSLEGGEPPHIHVEKDRNYAKFWLEPVELAKSTGFKLYELNEIHKYVIENKDLFKETWNAHFGIH